MSTREVYAKAYEIFRVRSAEPENHRDNESNLFNIKLRELYRDYPDVVFLALLSFYSRNNFHMWDVEGIQHERDLYTIAEAATP